MAGLSNVLRRIFHPLVRFATVQYLKMVMINVCVVAMGVEHSKPVCQHTAPL
jgi:hypothetical protein